ncbi:uncharacterized small protein (DUF1192 family) [Methylopila capsulata]|uniref:Uncharacterized small protein (DUF1192 family) n=1 Tax=Methylopila capsulata TaxID=61654 RepID=A0A9W6IVY8_9HYPH|nr:DUF1192 domain-containing protein [Methylopila capsulata]MBM7850827.1 uncharacterized small protein (DUF1192 family) [Methylopila capsulata]GLK56121.1 hypothetical protein GCM10008170_21400 [Methylopila capsulata]
MSLFDDGAAARPQTGHVIGQDLGAVSIDELQLRIATLQAEIARLEAEVAAKTAQRSAADQLFRR